MTTIEKILLETHADRDYNHNDIVKAMAEYGKTKERQLSDTDIEKMVNWFLRDKKSDQYSTEMLLTKFYFYLTAQPQ